MNYDDELFERIIVACHVHRPISQYIDTRTATAAMPKTVAARKQTTTSLGY